MLPISSLRSFIFTFACLAAAASSAGCSDSAFSVDPQQQVDCEADPLVRTTDEGVEFVRTPSGCFQDLPGFPHELKSVDIDGLRQGYVDEGPADAPVVLLLHGQPTWAFLYRKMIPVLVDAGHRAIAMDHLGMGYSDKPIDIADYSYLGHIDRLEKFIEALGLRDIPDEDEAAYDAPFPSRIYMAGPRVFPSLVNELGGANQDAWAGLTQFQKPFLTVWASNDPGNLGTCQTQDHLINNIPGADGLPHTRLPEASHFLQDDQGAEIARRIVELMESN
ncbi:MAG: alpha/beta fold hydrolase [Deltaproteobacteria bacterium]